MNYFAGGNTPQGFFSYFDNIAEKDCRLIILKGGPGVGKSTFMKKVAKNLNPETEFFYCSGDPASLDGIHNKKAKIAVIDGTAPHCQDPHYPGICDSIVNLGMFIRGDKLKKHAGKIIKNTDKKAVCYYNAYQYLAAAQKVDQIKYKNDLLKTDYKKIDIKINRLSEEYEKIKDDGSCRKLFLQAITPLGIIDFRENNFQNRKVFDFSSVPERSLFFSGLSENLVKNGYDIECYYSPLYPQDIESLYIKNLNWFLTHENTCSAPKNQKLTEKLIDLSIDELYKARASHKENEKYYIESMDFEALEDYSAMLIESLVR